MIELFLKDNDNLAFRVERLESHMRRDEKATMELSRDFSVLNRKVELILDQLQADSFLKEESKEEGARAPHQAVQSVSQADAETSAA